MSDMSYISKEPMMEMFLFETNQLLEQLEEILLIDEKKNKMSPEDINEIFRIMHTIKGSAAMMMYKDIASLSHALEDLFQLLRETDKSLNCSRVCDFSLKTADFIKGEIHKIESGEDATGDNSELVKDIRNYLLELKGESCEEPKESKESKEAKESDTKQKYYITSKKEEVIDVLANRYIIKIYFDEDCQMENVRAYSVIHNISEHCNELYHRPSSLFDNDCATESIIKDGFDLYIATQMDEKELMNVLDQVLFVKSYSVNKVISYDIEVSDLIKEVENVVEAAFQEQEKEEDATLSGKGPQKALKQNLISVNINKLDILMDLVGEIVITESMVTKNKDLAGLDLENFNKSARQLRKLTDELQDIVMSIRMIPISSTFNKMNRIVRDMSKGLNKDVELVIIGEETEVDKNIIDNLSDPLMHLIRNSMDHGIETIEERKQKNKNTKAKLTLGAQNAGGEVLITVADDGKGLDREKILAKARESGLITKSEADMSDKEVFYMILLPGFSTKEKITEYSGRGVGMDVVKKNIEKLGGTITIDSQVGKGTTITIKIPLTLAIVDGMEISVGSSIYTVPTVSIRESFKPEGRDIIKDTEGNEMIMIRGNCYPIVRLHRLFGVEPKANELCDGIMVVVEEGERHLVLFADELLGEQQVVVKPLPSYLARYGIKDSGIGGCTILGDGSISLIVDVVCLTNRII